MIDYQPNKVILTGEDAIWYAEARMQDAASKIQSSVAPWAIARMAEIVQGLKKGNVDREIVLTRKAVDALSYTTRGLEIVCSKEDQQ